MIDIVSMLFIAAAIIIIGFLANLLFKKTGWPEILFLIFIGVLLGPILNLFPKNDIIPFLPLISTFTLLMVLFGGGLELNLSEISEGGFRSIFQTIAYFALGLIFVTLFTYFILGWQLIDGLLLGSMISTTGQVVIIPLAKKIGVQSQTATLLSMESVIGSIICIVFFFAFLTTKLNGTFDYIAIVKSISAEFAVGIAIGVVMAIPWVWVLSTLEENELAYIATLGYVIACYAISETLMGSGALAVLAFGVILGNDKRVSRTLRMRQSPSFSEVKTYLMHFQTELSFILRAFFFVALGLIFDVSLQSVLTGLSVGIPIVLLLFTARYLVVSVSTWRSPMASEKGIITGMFALGLTPALLSFIILQYDFPNAHLFPLIVTNITIMTAAITSISALVCRRSKKTKC
ncbi:MAG: cation:proton antiporter [Candidatus Bathyarchaeia archaeon]